MPKVQKYGGSLGITLPAAELEALGIRQGDEVVVRRRGSLLEVVPVELRPKLRPHLQTLFDEGVREFGPALERLAK
jgi:antitoxin component of MazEF toxin-antitoxin module